MDFSVFSNILSYFRIAAEQVSILMEPFLRRLGTLKQYVAYLNGDEKFFKDEAEGNEVSVTGCSRWPVRFPTVQELLELKRFEMI